MGLTSILRQHSSLESNLPQVLIFTTIDTQMLQNKYRYGQVHVRLRELQLLLQQGLQVRLRELQILKPQEALRQACQA
jgi:hypothetical protein